MIHTALQVQAHVANVLKVKLQNRTTLHVNFKYVMRAIIIQAVVISVKQVIIHPKVLRAVLLALRENIPVLALQVVHLVLRDIIHKRAILIAVHVLPEHILLLQALLYVQVVAQDIIQVHPNQQVVKFVVMERIAKQGQVFV